MKPEQALVVHLELDLVAVGGDQESAGGSVLEAPAESAHGGIPAETIFERRGLEQLVRQEFEAGTVRGGHHAPKRPATGRLEQVTLSVLRGDTPRVGDFAQRALLTGD